MRIESQNQGRILFWVTITNQQAESPPPREVPITSQNVHRSQAALCANRLQKEERQEEGNSFAEIEGDERRQTLVLLSVWLTRFPSSLRFAAHTQSPRVNWKPHSKDPPTSPAAMENHLEKSSVQGRGFRHSLFTWVFFSLLGVDQVQEAKRKTYLLTKVGTQGDLMKRWRQWNDRGVDQEAAAIWSTKREIERFTASRIFRHSFVYPSSCYFSSLVKQKR
jgi:hypothetical protein